MKPNQRVVTVTLNPAIDQTIFIPNFTTGAVNRVQSAQIDAGGKGINVASFLADYGQPTTATGFLGRANDEIFCRLFERKQIEDRCIRISGQTRTGVKICDEALHQTTDINFPGETPSPEDIHQLHQVLSALAPARDWFVLSGSVPRGVPPAIYADLVKILRGKHTILDTSGDAFRQALTAHPWLIKPNVDELSEYAGRPLETPEAIVGQARALMRDYAVHTVVVSMGKEGAIFVEGDETLWAVPPAVEVKSTVGAGDAMVAGIVVGKIHGLNLVECARLATAFSSTAVGQVGSGFASLEPVNAARERVTIQHLNIQR